MASAAGTWGITSFIRRPEGLIAGKPAPTGICTGFEAYAVEVGAGLPAIGLQSSPQFTGLLL